MLLPRSPWMHLARLVATRILADKTLIVAERIRVNLRFIGVNLRGTEHSEVHPFDLHALSTSPAFILS